MKVFTLSVLCGILLWPISGSAELYKWTDEQGNLHITDIPPPNSRKKSAPLNAKSSRSAPSQKMTGRSDGPGESHTAVSLSPESMPRISSTRGLPPQLATDGLKPHLATLISPWQLFDGPRSNAKAPVHRWKDEQGIDHFTDVLPAKKDVAAVVETSTKVSTKLRATVKRDSR